MKRFKKSTNLRQRRKVEWPDSPEGTSDIFEPRNAYRKLKVVVDANLLRDDYSDDVELSKELLLENLLSADLIKSYRYADNKPPEGVEPIVLEKHAWVLRNNAYAGWVVSYPFDEESGFWPVTYAESEKSFANTFVGGNVVQFAETDDASKAYHELDRAERALKRKADMLAYEVAVQGIEADVFITDREYLLSGGSRLVEGRGVLVASIKDAIPLLSLYLRAQGIYKLPTPMKNFNHTFNRGLFYWVGTRELLPEGWRWFSACVHHSSGSGDDKLLGLGGSTLSRVQRAIEARDRVHVALNRKTNNDINDDALGNLDHVLTLLMGAVDASARVAHYILGIPGGEYNAAWQRDKWLKEVRAEEPALASLFDKGSSQWHALEILRLLRNSVHGKALQGITLDANGEIDTVMRLPKEDELAILTSMDALGGRDAWGYKPFAPGYDNIKPGILVDKLMEECVKLLNAIMKATPVERLSHIEKVNLQNEPPVDEDSPGMLDIFSEWNRRAIRWQLGFWD
jgi:hypothetical protein